MYCTKCGSEINDKAVVCTKCGCATANYFAKTPKKKEDKNGMAIAGFVCSLLVPLLGLIFGAIGLGLANKRNGKFKGFAIAAVVISCVAVGIELIAGKLGIVIV